MMADNYETSRGVNADTFASDEIGGVHYPVTKIATGVVDSAAIVSSDDPMPVVLPASMIDATTGDIRPTEGSHAHIHEGMAYEVCGVNLNMASAATLILAFKTPSAPARLHFVVEFTSLVKSHIELLEGPTWTQGTGTQVAIHNRRRDTSMRSSGVLEDQGQASFIASDTAILDPTITDDGAVIDTLYAFAIKNRSTGQGRDRTEWDLEPDTLYAVRLTSDDNSGAGQLILNWYEHDDLA